MEARDVSHMISLPTSVAMAWLTQTASISMQRGLDSSVDPAKEVVVAGRVSGISFRCNRFIWGENPLFRVKPTASPRSTDFPSKSFKRRSAESCSLAEHTKWYESPSAKRIGAQRPVGMHFRQSATSVVSAALGLLWTEISQNPPSVYLLSVA